MAGYAAAWKKAREIAEKEPTQEATGEIPVRPGQCHSCRRGSFTLKLDRGQLLRTCKHCDSVINPETGVIIFTGESTNGDV